MATTKITNWGIPSPDMRKSGEHFTDVADNVVAEILKQNQEMGRSTTVVCHNWHAVEVPGMEPTLAAANNKAANNKYIIMCGSQEEANWVMESFSPEVKIALLTKDLPLEIVVAADKGVSSVCHAMQTPADVVIDAHGVPRRPGADYSQARLTERLKDLWQETLMLFKCTRPADLLARSSEEEAGLKDTFESNLKAYADKLLPGGKIVCAVPINTVTGINKAELSYVADPAELAGIFEKAGLELSEQYYHTESAQAWRNALMPVVFTILGPNSIDDFGRKGLHPLRQWWGSQNQPSGEEQQSDLRHTFVRDPQEAKQKNLRWAILVGTKA